MGRLSSCDRHSWAFVTIVTLVPLLILPGVVFHYDVTPKVVVILFGAAAALLLGGATAAVSRERRWLRILLLLQAIWMAISTAASTDPALSFTGSNWRRLGFVTNAAVLLLAWLFSSGVVRLLRAIAISGGLAAAYGIAQYFGFDPLIPREGYHIGEGIWGIVRPPGTLGHAGYFAVYLVHVAFVGVALAMCEAERRWRRMGAAAATLAAAAIVFSGTRAGLLGLAAGVAVLLAHRRPRLTVARAAVAAALAAGLALFYFSPAAQPLRSRVRWSREEPLGGGRAALWADTLRMAASRPLAGYGPETFASQFPRFQSEALARLYPERHYESPHNIFLEALADQGAPGLILLSLLCWLAVRAGRRGGPWGTALLACLAATVASNQFVVFTAPTALMFYVTVACLCALPESASAAPLRLTWLKPAALPLAAAALALAWTDFRLARTRHLLNRGRVHEAMASYRRLPGADTDLWYSRALLAAAPAAWQPAFDAARRAAQTSEQRPNAWYNLAAFYAMQNDFAGAEQSLRAAIAWAPNWYKPRWMLAQVLREAGRLPEAETEARRAAHLNAGKNPEVAQTWRQIQSQLQGR